MPSYTLRRSQEIDQTTKGTLDGTRRGYLRRPAADFLAVFVFFRALGLAPETRFRAVLPFAFVRVADVAAFRGAFFAAAFVPRFAAVFTFFAAFATFAVTFFAALTTFFATRLALVATRLAAGFAAEA